MADGLGTSAHFMSFRAKREILNREQQEQNRFFSEVEMTDSHRWTLHDAIHVEAEFTGTMRVGTKRGIIKERKGGW